MKKNCEKTTSGAFDYSWLTARRTALFFVLAYAISWLFWLPAFCLLPEAQTSPFVILGAFGPFLAAIVVVRANQGRAGLRSWLSQVFRLRVPVVLYVVAAFAGPVAVGFLQYGLYSLLGGQPDFPIDGAWYQRFPATFLYYPINLLIVALFFGGNEEPGWRGLGIHGLRRRFSPLVASLILGVTWATWHLPFIVTDLYPQSYLLYVLTVVPLSVITNWLYWRSRGSAIPVMLWHAGTNVIGNTIPTPDDVLPLANDPEVLRSIVYWAIALIIIAATKGQLGAREER